MTAKQIRDLRASLALTQRELALMLYVRRETVARWETGRQQPQASHVEVMKRLATPGSYARLAAVEVPVA